MPAALDRAHHLLGSGRLEEAEAILRSIIEKDPEHGQAFALLGAVSLNSAGPASDAETFFKKAISLIPDDPDCRNNFGTLLWMQGRYPEAENHFRKAVQLRPDFSRAYINLANTLQAQGQLQQCADACKRALTISPNWPGVYYNLGLVLSDLGLWEESLEYLNRDISLRPDNAKTRFIRGMLLLKLEQFESGWKDFDWRFEATGSDYISDERRFRNLWDGSSFKGKTLLVYHDQGLGDGIQFFRYLPMVKARGGKVKFLCGTKLIRLFSNSGYNDEIIGRWADTRDVSFDYHIPLLSLPRIFNTRLESIPAKVPYLYADKNKIREWAVKISSENGFKVGLVWSGKLKQKDNHRRSCSLSDYAPLSRIPGVVLYSLQKRKATEQPPRIPDGMKLYDYTDDLTSFTETAALIANLDLVITVDTAVAHLAGALGHPVWTILRFNHCWRYLLDRDDSPWYPSMKLFRQQQAGDWRPVIERLAVDLEKEVENRHAL